MATGAASDDLEELDEVELKPGIKPLPEAGVKLLKFEAEPKEAVT